MDGEQLKRHFERMGAALEIEELRPPRRGRWSGPVVDFALDVRGDKQETFVLAIKPGVVGAYEFTLLQIEPKERHLVLMATTDLPNAARPKQKFLCGHDERHWFVAGLPTQVTTVWEAFEALIPEEARDALVRERVRGTKRHRRHNAGCVRQGEWFFIPQPGFRMERGDVILEQEPMRRGRGKAHWAQELVRRGGETVYVNGDNPNGLTEKQYKDWVRANPETARTGWNVMVRDAQVYARGAVRHPDHKTVVLMGWHRVLTNKEETWEVVAFLD